MLHGTMLRHKMLIGVAIISEDLPLEAYAPNHRFCSIRDFPEVIESVYLGATLDSDYSMIILAMSTFSWGVYMFLLLGRFLLEKRLLVLHRKSVTTSEIVPMAQEHPYGITLAICLVIFIITIFGGSFLKKTKSEEDNFWVYVWEGMKLTLVAFFGCLHKHVYKN